MKIKYKIEYYCKVLPGNKFASKIFSNKQNRLRSAAIKTQTVVIALARSELLGRGCLNAEVSCVCTKVFFL